MPEHQRQLSVSFLYLWSSFCDSNCWIHGLGILLEPTTAGLRGGRIQCLEACNQEQERAEVVKWAPKTGPQPKLPFRATHPAWGGTVRWPGDGGDIR